MKKVLSALIAPAILCTLLFSCSKDPLRPQGATLTGDVPSDQSYSGFQPLTLVSGTTNWYSSGRLQFKLPTSTLVYWNGEPVTSYSIAALPGGELLDYIYTGNGGFTAYLPSMSAPSVNSLANAIEAYDTTWSGVYSRAMADTGKLNDATVVTGTQKKVDTTMLNYPVFSGYLQLVPLSGSELVYSGFVVRDHNSPSTYSIAPSTFKPVIKIETDIELGTYWPAADNGYYELDFYGDDIYGSLWKVNWFAANGTSGAEIAVTSYKLTVAPNSYGGFTVNGTVTIVPGLTVTLTNVTIAPGAVV